MLHILFAAPEDFHRLSDVLGHERCERDEVLRPATPAEAAADHHGMEDELPGGIPSACAAAFMERSASWVETQISALSPMTWTVQFCGSMFNGEVLFVGSNTQHFSGLWVTDSTASAMYYRP